MSEITKYRPCVGVVLFNQTGRAFMGERYVGDLPEHAPRWQFPQGGIDEGETPRAAAFRELEEETGVARNQVALLHELPFWLSYELPDHLVGVALQGKYRGQRQKWFAMRLTGDERAINLEAHEKPEFERWQWCTLDEAVARIIPFKREIYKVLAAQFAFLAHHP